MPKGYAKEFRQAVCERLVADEKVSSLSVGSFSIFGIRLTWSDPPGCRYAILGRCGWGVKAARYWVWS